MKLSNIFPIAFALIALIVAGLNSSAIVLAQGVPGGSDGPSIVGGAGSAAGTARNSSITGRVLTVSGQPLGRGAKITLRTLRSPLTTSFTDDNGEFRFMSLQKDTYCLDVVADVKYFKPATECVRMERDPSVVQLTIYLNLKDAAPEGKKKSGGHVVTVSELDQKVPAAAKKEYDIAVKSISQSETQRAVDHLKQALAIYPQYQLARNELGMQYRKLRQMDEASEQFKAALALNEDAFQPRLNLGMVLVEQKKFAEARDHLNRALKTDSANPAAHLYLGIAALGSDELSVAYEELSKTLILGDADFSIAHYYLAFIHLKRGERADALRELNTYLAASPEGELSDHARALAEKLK